MKNRQTYSKLADKLRPHLGTVGGVPTTIVVGTPGAGGGGGAYLPLDGSGVMAGDINLGGNDLINVTAINGIAVSALGHNRQHSITDPLDHTVVGSTWQIVGLTATNTLGLLTPSAAPNATEAILKTNSAGLLTLRELSIGVKITVALIEAGSLSIVPSTGIVTITGNLTLSDKLITPRIDSTGDLAIVPAGGDVNVTGSLSTTVKITTPLIESAADLSIVPAGGDVNVTGSLSASVKVTTPRIEAVGNLTIAPAGGITSVTGSLAVSLTLSTPRIDSAADLLIVPAGGDVRISGDLWLDVDATKQWRFNSLGGTSLAVAYWNGTTESNAVTIDNITLDIAVAADLSGTNWSIIAGEATMAGDSDSTHTLGRARVGSAVASDTATFAHYDHYSAASYALVQYQEGTTWVNAANTRQVYVGVNGVDTIAVTSDRINPRGSIAVDIGDRNRKFRTLHVAEVIATYLVAEEVISTIGGQINVSPTSELIADIPASAGGGGGSTAMPDNLISYWKLDEASGSRVDSKSTNNLTATNAPGSATGKINNGVALVGASNQRLSIADNAALSVGDIDFYIALSIYPTLDDGTVQCVASKAGAAGARAWEININWATNQIYFTVYNAADTATDVVWSSTITTNTWYFVECWHNATTNQIGIAINRTETTAAYSGGVKDDTGNFTIGARSTARFFTGTVDEFGFWKNYIPNTTERDFIYNSGDRATYAAIAAYGSVVPLNFDIKHNNFTSGTYLQMSGSSLTGLPQFEVFQLTSGPTSIPGGWRYSAIRDLDLTGANDWYVGDACASLGTNVGDGFINLTATQTMFNHYGPSVVQYVRVSTSDWDDVAPVTVQGNMRSYVDYTGDTFGFGAGNNLLLGPLTGFRGITIDPINGIRLFGPGLVAYNVSLQTVSLTSNGNLKLGSNVANADTTTFDFTNTGTLRVGGLGAGKANLYFDGSNLQLRQNTTPVIALNSDGSSSFVGIMTIGVAGGVHAGGGNVILNTNGLTLLAGTATTNQVKVTDGGVTVFQQFTHTDLVNNFTYTNIKAIGKTLIQPGFLKLEAWDFGATAPGSGIWVQTLAVFIAAQSTVSIGGSLDGVHSTAYFDVGVTIQADITAPLINLEGNLSTWQTLTLTSGWGNFGSTFTVAEYKKVGDIVMVRGLVRRNTGVSNIIATLPTGYRPTEDHIITTSSNDLYGQVRIKTDGTINLQVGSAATWVALDPIIFSIA